MKRQTLETKNESALITFALLAALILAAVLIVPKIKAAADALARFDLITVLTQSK